MHDSQIPPDMSAMGRIVIVFLFIFIAVTLLFELPGCATAKPPDPLVGGLAASNAAADVLTTAKADEERGFKADLLARLARCPVGDAACHQVASQEALAAHATDSDRLLGLAQLQRLIGSALLLAEECRTAKQAQCEADALHTVETRLPELRAGLVLLTQGITP